MSDSTKAFNLTQVINRYARINFNTMIITCVVIAVAFVTLQEAEKGTSSRMNRFTPWMDTISTGSSQHWCQIPLQVCLSLPIPLHIISPMFGIATGVAYALFGVTPFVARATSAFFGLVTLLFSYLLASTVSHRRIATSGPILLG